MPSRLIAVLLMRWAERGARFEWPPDRGFCPGGGPPPHLAWITSLGVFTKAIPTNPAFA